MDKPCCLGVVRDSAKLKGMDLSLSGAMPFPAVAGQWPAAHPVADQAPSQFYVCAASDQGVASNRIGCVVIHDIFGFDIPNCKYITDHLASKGSHCSAMLNAHLSIDLIRLRYCDAQLL